MQWDFLSIHPLNLAMLGALGFCLAVFSLRTVWMRKIPILETGGSTRDLDRLFHEITRALHALREAFRGGGLMRKLEKQEEVGRLLVELQRQLRMLDDHARHKYESRAGRILEKAAGVGITLPPP